MTKDSVRTREEELYYASCPICSTTLLQAETIAYVNLQDTIGRFCLNLSKTEKLQTFADETLG